MLESTEELATMKIPQRSSVNSTTPRSVWRDCMRKTRKQDKLLLHYCPKTLSFPFHCSLLIHLVDDSLGANGVRHCSKSYKPPPITSRCYARSSHRSPPRHRGLPLSSALSITICRLRFLPSARSFSLVQLCPNATRVICLIANSLSTRYDGIMPGQHHNALTQPLQGTLLGS